MKPISATQKAKATEGTALCRTCRHPRPLADFQGKRDPSELVKTCIGCRRRLNTTQLAGQLLRTRLRTLYLAALATAEAA